MTISLILDVAVAMDADRCVIGSGTGALTASRLRDLARGGATVLRDSGARTLVFVGVNSSAFPVALFAAAAAGVPIAPLNYRLADSQLIDLVRRLDEPLIVVDPAFLPMFDETGYEIGTTQDWLARCASELHSDSELPSNSEPFDDDPAVLLFTSGTTAEPKCVILRHRNLESYVFGTVEPGSAAADDAALVSVPPYHIAGVGTVLTNVLAGRRLLYLPNFTAASWVQLVAEEGVTFAMVVPTMLSRIVDELGEGPTSLGKLGTIAYGGAPVTQSVLECAMDRLPGVDFVNAYGLTETSSTIAVLGPQDHRVARAAGDPAVRGRLRSVGRLIPGIEGEIRAETGGLLAVGEVGQLWVRGDQVSGEYAGQASGLDSAGWFHTKDRASFDGDGYLYISGRSDDVIIRGGENIAPEVIENVIADLDGVLEVAVVGVPDVEWGERIVAVVVPEPGAELTCESIESWARSHLRSSRTPDVVLLRDQLPRNDMGKIVRRILRAELAG